MSRSEDGVESAGVVPGGGFAEPAEGGRAQADRRPGAVRRESTCGSPGGAGPAEAAATAGGHWSSSRDQVLDSLPDGGVPAWCSRTLGRLSHSRFRSGFSLNAKDRSYARAKGRAVIDRHAHELLAKRVGPALPPKDGRQTPYRGHPVFTAQHATGTCCRGCIERWHGIPKGRPLTDREVDRLAALVMAWIERDLKDHPA